MPKPNTNLNTGEARNSLNSCLIELYEGSRAGGAYDAKSIKKWGSHAPMSENSLQSRLWTTPGFKVGMSSTEYINMKGSTYTKGHSIRRYSDWGVPHAWSHK